MKKKRDEATARETGNKSATILIVDSDARERRRLSALFNGNGFKAVAAGTGGEALAAAKATPFNAIVLAAELSDTPGPELIRPLRTILPAAAIIMVSTDPKLDTAVRSVNEGAVGFFSKPLNVEDVMARLAEVIDHRGTAGTEPTPPREAPGDRERSRMITENMSDLVWVMDMDLTLTYASPSVVKARGYTFEELRKMPLNGHVTPASFEAVTRIIADEMTPERLSDKTRTVSRNLEMEFIRKDGTTFWVEAAMTVLRDENGRLKEIIGIGRDITERRKIEGDLFKASREWRITFDSIADMISILDADYRILRVNKAFADYLETSPKNVVGKRCFEVFHATSEPPPFCPHKGVFETKGYVETEAFEPRFGRYLQVMDSPIFDADGNVTGTVHVIRDITDRKESEAALRKSDRRWRDIFESSRDAVYLSSFEGRFLDINKAGEELFGYTRDELLEIDIQDMYVRPDERKVLVNRIREEGFVKDFETSLRLKNGAVADCLITATPLLDDDGTPIGIQGIMRDVTDRKRAEAALVESEVRYRRLFEAATVGIFHSLPEGRYLRVNPALARMVGFDSPEEMVSSVKDIASELYVDPGQRAALHEESVKKGGWATAEGQFKRRDGSFRWGRLSVHPVYDAEGAIEYFEGFTEDITERKISEEKLTESEESLSVAQRVAGVGSWDWDLTNDRLVWSEETFRIFGRDPATYIPVVSDALSLVHPEDRELLEREVLGAIERAETYKHEYRIISPDGGIRRVFAIGEVIRDDAGRAVRIRGAVQDITERKRAEEALRESEERYRELFENIGNGVAVYEVVDGGKDFIFRDFNKAGERIDGDRREDLIGKSIFDVRPGAEKFGLIEVFRRVYETGKPEYFPMSFYEDEKLSGWYENYIYKLSSREIVSVFDNITERKRAEEELRLSESRLRLAYEAAKAGAWEWDVRTGENIWSDEIWELYGLAPRSCKPSYEVWRQVIHPEDRATAEAAVQGAARGGGELNAEWRVNLPKGKLRWLMSRGTPQRNEQGEVIRYQGIVIDITERKRAEEALVKSETLLNATQHLARIGGWEWDVANNTMFWTDEAYLIHGISPGEITPGVDEHIGASIECYDPDDRPVILAAFERCTKKGIPYDLEFPFTTRRGDRIWIRTTAEAVYEGKKIVRVLGTIADITDRKRADDALRESEERFKQVAESAGEWIWEVDADGRYSYVSPVVESVLGYKPEEIIGTKHFYDFFHPEDRESSTAEAEAAFGARRPFRGLVNRNVHRDGRTVWLDTSGTPLFDDTGEFYGYRGADTDITEKKQAEEALQRSERQLKLMLMNMINAFVLFESVFNENGEFISYRFVFINEAYERITGVKSDEVKGKTVHEVWPGTEPSWIKAYGEVALTGIPSTFEMYHEATGKLYYCNVYRPSESKEHFCVIFDDITDRKRAEEVLLDSEERYRNLVENINDIVFSLDTTGAITYISPVAEAVTGFSPGDLVGRNFAEFVHPDDLPRLIASLEKTLQDIREESEFRVITKDGSHRYVRSSSNPVFEDGSVVGISGLMTDITERKQAEDNIQEINKLLFERTIELRQSEEKFRSLFETSRDFMAITDLEGRLIDTNAAAREFFGYTPEELSDITILDLYPNPEDRKEIINGIVEKGYATNLEAKLKKKSGEIIDVLVSVNLKRDENGNPVHFFASARDITEKRRMEQQLLQSEKLSAVGTMISGVAHELNNPLTSIIGNAQLLSRRDVPDDIRAKLEVILRESKRSAKIVGGLLAFAREHKPERKMTDINEIVIESLKLREYDLKVSGIDVRTSFSDDLPETSVDPYQIEQVFINLINNARDALAGQERAALIIRTYRSGDTILVEFDDNGPGIPDAIAARIFDPFFTTKDVGKGTGLGLSMAYGIIKEHNGDITLESKPGQGARFIVKIPIAGDPQHARPEAGTPVPARPGARSILVVEDEPSLRDLISDALTEAGFFTDNASNGEVAIDLIGKKKYDAIVSDIKMPGIDGKGIYLYVHKYQPDLAERIIFITGDVLSKETQKFLEVTNGRFIEKPFNVDALIAAVNDVLSA